MLPETQYLQQIGELAYRVSYLEAIVIGDLGAVLPSPTGLDHSSLLGKTTRQIADAVKTAAQDWEDPALQAFGFIAEEALRDVAERRNHVLHARPATTGDGLQMLLRDRFLKNGKRDHFWIDESHLGEQIDAVEAWTKRVVQARVVSFGTN